MFLNSTFIGTQNGIEYFNCEGDSSFDLTIFGSPIFYPFDSYYLNLTFLFPSNGELNATTPTEFRSNMLYQEQSGWFAQKYGNMTIQYTPVIDVITATQGFIIGRTFPSTLPIMMILWVGYFLLAATLLIEHRDLSTKATVFTTIFVFFATLYFNFSTSIPPFYAMSFGASLILYLIFGGASFFVMGLVQNFVTKRTSVEEYKVEWINHILMLIPVGALLYSLISFVEAFTPEGTLFFWVNLPTSFIWTFTFFIIAFWILVAVSIYIKDRTNKKKKEKNWLEDYPALYF